MRVTITIDDDDAALQSPGTQTPHVRGPHVRGPSLVLPLEDGSETEIDIADLAATVEKAKKEG